MSGRIPGMTYSEIIRAARAHGDWNSLPQEMAADVLHGLSLAKKSMDGGGSSQGIPAYWFSRAIETGGAATLYQPYRNSVWVQRAIKKVAGPVAAVEVVFMKPGGGRLSDSKREKRIKRNLVVGTRKGVAKKAKADFVDVPKLSEWLSEPAKGLGWSDFIEATIGWLKLKGEAFWLLSDEMSVPFPEVRKGKIPPLVVARPDRMRHVVENGVLIAWVFTDAGGKQYTLVPEQVIHLKYWNPYDQWRGLAEYEAAHVAAEGDYLAGRFSRNISANNGDKGPIIVSKNGVPTDPQREQIINELRAKREAQLRGEFRPIFMTGDISVEDPQIQTVDGDFISQRLGNRHEIATAFGVPMSMFDVKNDYSMGSQSAYYQLILDTCIPCGAKICDALERLGEKLTGTIYEIGLLWDEHPVLQAVRRERIDSMSKLADRGMPMDEISEYLHLDLPEFPGSDVGYMPISSMPVGSATDYTDPAEDPALAETKPSTDLTAAAGAENVQATALNGAQVQALADLAEKVATGNLPVEAALALAQAAFPLIDLALLQRIFESLRNFEPPAPEAPRQIENANAVPAVREMFKALRSKVERRKSAKHLLWETHMRNREASVRMMAGKVGRVLNQYRGEVLRKLDALSGQKSLGGTVEKNVIDVIFDPTRFGKDLVTALNAPLLTALQTASDQLRKGELNIVDPWKFPPQKALEHVQSRTQPIQDCGQTVRDQLNTALSEGYEAGESTKELSDRVRSVFNGLTKGEAERVARTETGIAFGFARDEAMKEAGIEYKAWLSSHGPNVRPAHEAAEADKPVPIDEPFIVGGEALMYPGDPNGSAGNIINCQCVQIAVMNPKEV